MSFQPSNITSFKDLDNKYREQIALLRVQAENEKKIMDALRGKESGVLPQFELPVSLEERLQDENFQRSLALKNLKNLFDDSTEASKTLNRLDNYLIKVLNRLFPFIQSDFGTKYSQFDADFFIDYLEKLIAVTESQKGYLAQYMPASVEDDNKDIRENTRTQPEGGVISYYDLDDLKKYKIPTKYRLGVKKDLGARTIEKYMREIMDLMDELQRKIKPVLDRRVEIGDSNIQKYLITQSRIFQTLDELYAAYSKKLFEKTGRKDVFTPEEKQQGGIEEEDMDKFIIPGSTFGEEDFYDIPEEETKEEVIPTTGSGMRRYGRYTKGGRLNTRVIMGRGLSIEQPIPNNVEFGKFMLNQKQLRNGILSMKYKSGGPIPEIKKTQISDNLKDFIFDLLDSQKINQALYKKLSMDDKKLFRKIVTLAHLNKKLGVKDIRDDNEDIKRFELVRGQYLAGNNADSVKHELVKLIYKFSLGGKISVNDAEDIITSLIH